MMLFIGLFIALVFIGFVIEYRRNYSRYIVHAENFLHKLLIMSMEDSYWLGVYETMGSVRQLARIAQSRGLHTVLNDEQYALYCAYDTKHGVKL